MRQMGFWLLGLMLLAPCRALGKDNDKWISLQSPHFLLVGNVPEGNLRQQAAQLEQFRNVVGSFLFSSRLPFEGSLRVVIFNDEKSFDLFKPRYEGKPMEVGGYFSATPDLNYIATFSGPNNSSPRSVIFHEYTHFLLKDFNNIPLWLNEGLAEFYSTFELSGGGKDVVLGRAIPAHVRRLQEKKLLPLDTLFRADSHSPWYNENEKLGLFYAESWALTHYLIQGSGHYKREQLGELIALLQNGHDVESSFEKAFQTSLARMEQELSNYVLMDNYPSTRTAVNDQLPPSQAWPAKPLAESEVLYYLGDLQAHGPQPEAAEGYLKRALAADPLFDPAMVSLGFLALRQGIDKDARRYMEAGLSQLPGTAFDQFHLAWLLYAQIAVPGGADSQLRRQRLQRIQAALEKAVELDPLYLASYQFVAYLACADELDAEWAISLLKRALEKIPNTGQISLYLATIYFHQRDIELARHYLAASLQAPVTTQVFSDAKELAARVNEYEQRRPFEGTPNPTELDNQKGVNASSATPH